jgi:hypothetical protein
MMDKGNLIPIKLEPIPRTKKEISAIYRFSYQTLRRKLASNGIETTKGLINPHLQEKIFNSLGYEVKWIL